jgi:hypothetical protein
MSTLATADLHSSDEEGDADFIPTARPSKKRKITVGARSGSGSGSESGSSSDDSDDDPRSGARAEQAEQREKDSAERKRAAAEAFASFKEATGPDPSERRDGAQEEMVNVKRERRFAGETIV